jgi:tetratricopeptide (TPR) repeat protein
MAKVLSSLRQITRTPLLLSLGFLILSLVSCSTESSNGNDMQDNGLAFMKQIVQPIRDNIKKEKELWGEDATEDEESEAENLELYKEYAEKTKGAKKQIKAHPENTQAYLDLAEAIEYQEIFNPKADDNSREKAHRERVRWMTTAIKKHPDNKEFYRKRAEAYFANEQWQKAKADYNQIISMDPQDGDAISSRSRIYEKLKLKKEAQQDFIAYNQIQLETADDFHWRGYFNYSRGDFDLAEKDFSKDIELDPIKGDGYIFRAEIYFAQSRYDDSISDYKKMIEIEPDLAGLGWLRTGFNYYYQGKYKKAEDAFVKTLKVAPHLGIVVAWYLSRHQQGKSSKAALEYMANQFSDKHLDGAVIHLFLDKISPEELLNKKSDPPETVEGTTLSSAYYYLGQYYLMRDNPSKAKAMFEKSIQVAKTWYMPMSLFSEKELARLKLE